MDTSLIYAKTPKGLVEIRKRSGRLSPLMRRILIMINGRSDLSELEPAAPPGQLPVIIEALESEGLIEVSDILPTALPEPEDEAIGFDLTLPLFPATTSQRTEPRFNLPTLRDPSPAPPVAAAAATAAAAPPASPSASLPPTHGSHGIEERKIRAVRELFNLLGPYGESAAASIRECSTIGELLASLREAGSRISIFRGQAVARDYLRAHGVDVDAMFAPPQRG